MEIEEFCCQDWRPQGPNGQLYVLSLGLKLQNWMVCCHQKDFKLDKNAYQQE